METLGKNQEGLSPAFVRLLTDAQFDLYAFISMILGNREAAKDVLQDTNVMLMRHAGEYDDERAFLPWAKAFAYNQARTYLKRESRSRVVFDDDLVTAVAQDALAEPEESGLELKWLDFCLERLLPSQQALIRARYFRRESIEHLAAALRRTPISVYVQIHRIRRLLGACVESRRRHAEEGVGT